MSILTSNRLKHVALCLLMAGIASATEGLEMPAPAVESMGQGMSPKAAARRYSEMWLEVRVNGTDLPRPAHMLRLSSGELLASAEDLARWRVRSPLAAPITIKGTDYYPLDA